MTGTLLEGSPLGRQAYIDVKSIDNNPATVYIDFYFIFKYTAD
jgi:hypothetical protein